ncbi:MAG: Mur ligase family protein, partial [Peptostreptococcaceae bacterium]
MRLIDVMKNINFEYIGKSGLKEIEINTISYNSRYSKPNDMFVCIKGETVDGHKYAAKAYEKGSRVFIAEDTLHLPEDAHILYVADSRIALSKASANFFEHPTSEITIVGVTGTKGKTTITNYISTVLNSAGVNTGVIGTNGIFYNGKYEDTVNTTPESYELHKSIRKMVDEGIKCVCMEVSSGGIMMNRVNDIDFDIAVFTNLAEDHIGPKEHPTFEHYLNCKAKLFTMAKHGIINIDDEYSDEIIKKATCNITTFSIEKPSEHRATNINYSNNINSLGTDYICSTKDEEFKVHIAPPGVFNVYNSLAVIAVCEYM